MDADRFDTLARSLTIAGSRRRVLGLLSGVTLGILTPILRLADAEAGKRKKKKKKKKRKGATPTATAPTPPPTPPNPCEGKADETVCGEWTVCDSPRKVCGDFCSGGVCAPLPTCNGSDDPCGAKCCEPAGASCTGFPNPSLCGCSSIGNPCYSSGDCCGGGICVGWVCQWPST